MTAATALATSLVLVCDAVQNPDVNPAHEIGLLASGVGDAVPSYQSVTITRVMQHDSVVVEVPTVLGGAASGTSMRLIVPGSGSERNQAIEVTFFAAAPGAFVDLSAELSEMFSVPLAEIMLDRHLADTDVRTHQVAKAITISDLSVIDCALDALVAQGHAPDQARYLLTRSALQTGITMTDAAAIVLAAL